MIPKIETRAATSADLPALAQIWQLSWHTAHFEHVPASLAAIRTPAIFLERLTDNLENTITAGPIGQPLGFVTTKGAEINQLFVSPAAQGTGTANALITAGQTRIKQDGHKTAYLDVIPENARAISFYLKMGWYKGEIQTVMLDGGTQPYPLPCLIMYKKL